MSESKIYTKNEVLAIADMLIGKTFGELNKYKIDTNLYNKGSFGHILEEDVFQYDSNSKSIPDFENAGIELKVTPYKVNKNKTLSAKERLVLNIINYMEEHKNTFYTSHFWYKNKLIEIIWYLYEEDKNKEDFKITHSLLFSFPKDDLPIIIQDWNTIINKIKAGKTHELSEADTMYLGACTKGVNSKSVREQPFSNTMAKQRAFCLKTSYMTQLVRSYIGGMHLEKIKLNMNLGKTFQELLVEKLLPYKGMSINDLVKLFSINSKPKNLNEIIIARMLGLNGKVSNTDEFIKANIIPKTIRIGQNGKIKESMSFSAFKFEKIILEEWDKSDLYEMFDTTIFMFAVFKEYNGQYHFEYIKFWNLPMDILDNEIKKVWEKTVNVIKNGDIVKSVQNGKRVTNFPGMSESKYCHVRPHAQNANDTYPLPVTDKVTGLNKYTKHCFWFNNLYILEVLHELNN